MVIARQERGSRAALSGALSRPVYSGLGGP
ncbi:hypothetical protein SCE1572_06835 [Sorangium cellulosum So0157-2]|uniref:Uncharacterized protein n=1 Tax=Sorangium cellulosum So0157-2 TaxID=1254432 RepID=S4XUF4_SORCE|nr:hypothetical protein SCE1572_06835 [Sorangium cellulosum So0157-2]